MLLQCMLVHVAMICLILFDGYLIFCMICHCLDVFYQSYFWWAFTFPGFSVLLQRVLCWVPLYIYSSISEVFFFFFWYEVMPREKAPRGTFFFFMGYGNNRIHWKRSREWEWWRCEIILESLGIQVRSLCSFHIEDNPSLQIILKKILEMLFFSFLF